VPTSPQHAATNNESTHPGRRESRQVREAKKTPANDRNDCTDGTDFNDGHMAQMEAVLRNGALRDGHHLRDDMGCEYQDAARSEGSMFFFILNNKKILLNTHTRAHTRTHTESFPLSLSKNQIELNNHRSDTTTKKIGIQKDPRSHSRRKGPHPRAAKGISEQAKERDPVQDR
jgi:hypothetical protein